MVKNRSSRFNRYNLLAAILLLVFPAASLATEIFVYIDPNGKKFFTDRHMTSKDYIPINHSHHIVWKPTPLTTERRDRYDNDIRFASRSYDVDAALIKAVIHAESHFDPEATSKAGAKGLMQLMPATAAIYNLRGDHQLHNPRQNILAGTQYLQYLLEKFNNDLTLSLAAYNAGEGHVRRYGGIPPFKETRNYVKKVKKLYDKYKTQVSS